MTKRQDLYLQRRSRSEQSDQRQPNQAKNISHQPRASPNSTPLTSRIEFPTMTGDTPGRKVFLCCRCKLGAIENPFGVTIKSSRRYSHPRSPNAERSTPGGAYHPVEP